MKPRSIVRPRLLLGAAVSTAVVLLSGCATYEQQSADFAQSTRSGSFASAVTQIDKKAEAAKGSKDEIIWRLEQGASLRAAALADPSLVPPIPAPVPAAPAVEGEGASEIPVTPTREEVQMYYLRRSNAAFDLAEARVNAYEEEAKVKVGSEIGSALTNQANMPYRGRAYDKVMMNAYKAINYLQLGRIDDARVELNRSLQRQRDAVAENEKRIAEAQEIAQRAKSGEVQTEDSKAASYDTEKALNDPKTGSALQAALDESLAPMKPYGDYVNPFAVFLDGLFFSTLGENGSDWERGRKSFERVAAIVPENPYLQQDLALAADAAEGKLPENVTYVIFETGTGPFREQIRIDIPTFLVTSRLAYIGAAFPKLRYNHDYVPALAVSAGELSLTTATIASVDSIVANDFKNEWPEIVTRTLVTTATKAITQAVAQKVAEDRGGMWGGLIASAAMGIFNASTNIADTRGWLSLPKEFQYARLETPADRQLTLQAGGTTQTVSLVPGSVNVVYVKSSSSSAPLLVSQFALK
ncbi:MAG: hypothetical protein NVV63_03860 [Opitutus sp.]|nr:hypothetical protein [Opitutus sp.]